ncbi:hypothetical protein ACLB2K_034970 [Fragaria x ananassa]
MAAASAMQLASQGTITLKKKQQVHHLVLMLARPDVERTSALRLKVRTSSVLCRLTPATASLLPGRQHRLPGRLLSFQDWPATSFPANLDQSWCFPSRASIRPENLSPASPERRETVLEACAVIQEGEKLSPA